MSRWQTIAFSQIFLVAICIQIFFGLTNGTLLSAHVLVSVIPAVLWYFGLLYQQIITAPFDKMVPNKLSTSLILLGALGFVANGAYVAWSAF